MSPVSKTVWGPAAWTLMHSSAAACDAETAAGFSAFLYSLTHVLPCPECRAHLNEYLQEHPPDEIIVNAETASRFCFDLHNYVNLQTGKRAQASYIIHKLYNIQLGIPDTRSLSNEEASSASGARPASVSGARPSTIMGARPSTISGARHSQRRRRSFHIL